MNITDYIYDLMTGVINRQEVEDSESDIIPEDPFFEKNMDEIYEARLQLSKKLGVEPDECRELQIIMDRYSELCRYLSKRMFTYGAKLSKK